MTTSEEKEKIRKQNLFKGTISVAVVYAVIATLLLILIYFTEKGKQLVEGSNFPFVISFAIGMLAVISFLIYKVVTFKPILIQKAPYDDLSCPDYWKLEKTPDSVLNALTDPEQKPSRKYRCVIAGERSNVGSSTININKDSNDSITNELATVATTMYGSNSYVYNNDQLDITKVKVDCTMLYPKIISNYDVTNHPDSLNAIRCAYADKCALTWSTVCNS